PVRLGPIGRRVLRGDLLARDAPGRVRDRGLVPGLRHLRGALSRPHSLNRGSGGASRPPSAAARGAADVYDAPGALRARIDERTRMRQLLVLFACVAASGAFAAEVSKPELTLDAPDGWVEVPSAVLQAFYDELKRQTPLGQVPKYDYAFQAAAGPPWLSYPYVLVKITPGGRPSEHDLETLPGIDLNSKVREQRDGW